MAEMTVSARVGRYLAGLARRLKDNPGYMAYVLTIYQTQEHVQDDALAERLGTTSDMLARLALCRRPAAESAAFANQVRQIAAYTRADPALLANVVRQVSSLETLAKRPMPLASENTSPGRLLSAASLLAAARDRGNEDGDQSPPSETESTEGD